MTVFRMGEDGVDAPSSCSVVPTLNLVMKMPLLIQGVDSIEQGRPVTDADNGEHQSSMTKAA